MVCLFPEFYDGFIHMCCMFPNLITTISVGLSLLLSVENAELSVINKKDLQRQTWSLDLCLLLNIFHFPVDAEVLCLFV